MTREFDHFPLVCGATRHVRQKTIIEFCETNQVTPLKKRRGNNTLAENEVESRRNMFATFCKLILSSLQARYLLATVVSFDT